MLLQRLSDSTTMRHPDCGTFFLPEAFGSHGDYRSAMLALYSDGLYSYGLNRGMVYRVMAHAVMFCIVIICKVMAYTVTVHGSDCRHMVLPMYVTASLRMGEFGVGGHAARVAAAAPRSGQGRTVSFISKQASYRSPSKASQPMHFRAYVSSPILWQSYILNIMPCLIRQ